MTPQTRKNRAYRSVEIACQVGIISKGARATYEAMARTTPIRDWGDGATPLCFESVNFLALDLDITPRSLNRHIHQLEEAGLITRRVGSRGARSPGLLDRNTGERRFARGIDLSPAITAQHPDGDERRHDKRQTRSIWEEIRALKGQAEGALSAPDALPRAIADTLSRAIEGVPTRFQRSIVGSLDAIKSALVDALEALAAALTCGEQTVSLTKESDTSDSFVRPNTTTSDSIPSEYCSRPVDNDHAVSASRRRSHFQKNGADAPHCLGNDQCERDRHKQNRPSAPEKNTGIERIPIEMALRAASPSFVQAFEMQTTPGWRGMVEAAALLRPDLGISEDAWREACGTLGREGAALCILIADARKNRGEIRKSVGGFLRGMVRKAATGQLHLSPTIFGLAGNMRAS